MSFSSKQVGFGYDDIMCRVYGVNGTADAHYSGEIMVRARDDIYNGGKASNIYSEGVTNNAKTFYNSITKGDYTNPTVTPSVRSNLTTILGRTAAYKNGRDDVEQILAQKRKVDGGFERAEGVRKGRLQRSPNAAWHHCAASRIAANRFRPVSADTGRLDFSSACSTSSAGNSLRNGDGWQGMSWPYFFRPPQWLMVSVCIARVTAT